MAESVGGFEEFDLGEIGQNEQPEQMQNREGDDTLYVRFFMHPHPDKAATLEEGRPIYRDKVYIEIMIPGDRSNVVNRPVRMPKDAQRFPKHWQAFQAGEKEQIIGTPLSMWPAISRGMVEELKYFQIHTVEQLAAVPDEVSQRFMGITLFKQRAQDYVDAAKGNAATDQLREEINSKDAQVNALQQAVDELSATVAELKGAKRPRKAAAKKEPMPEPEKIEDADPEEDR